MTFDDFENRLKAVKLKLIQARPRLALAAASDMTALIKLRIHDTGKDYNGVSFSPYTK